ncbi:hypothetical protein TNCV_1500751 [Trichonephila clavipes]|nr:hypothetical protein TNCV_1500751 [Trichonephila clavipes]
MNFDDAVIEDKERRSIFRRRLLSPPISIRCYRRRRNAAISRIEKPRARKTTIAGPNQIAIQHKPIRA